MFVTLGGNYTALAEVCARQLWRHLCSYFESYAQVTITSPLSHTSQYHADTEMFGDMTE